MVHYERQDGVTAATQRPWIRWCALSAIAGGILTAVINLYLFTVLNPQEFVLIEPPGILGGVLLTLGVAGYYVSERHWFGRFAQVGFAMMALGTIVTAVALPIAIYGPGVVFFAYVLGVLVLAIGALVFGIAMVRAKAPPRTAAWLLIAALPVGLPLVVGFTTYVMGESAEPWAGPLVFYGLAWIVFGRYLLARGTETGTEPSEAAAH